MEAIGHLNGIWCSAPDGPTVIGRVITGDYVHARMLLEPGRSGFRRPIGKQINYGMTLTIGEDRAEQLAFAKREIVDTEHARCGQCRHSDGVRPLERVSPLADMALHALCRSPASPPKARATSRSATCNRSVRWVAGAMSAGRRSLKVTAGQAGFTQRKRRSWSRRRTG